MRQEQVPREGLALRLLPFAARLAACLLSFAFLIPTHLIAPSGFTQGGTRARTVSRTTTTPAANEGAGAQTDSQKKPSHGDATGQVRPEDATSRQQKSQVVDEDEVVRITTSEVLLPVTVRDASGQLVTDLLRSDFRVFEEGREQPLSDLALRQVPVDVALMIDASSSVAANLDDFRRAAEEFAARVAADDRVSLIKFDDRIELLLDWTKSRTQLRRALRRVAPGVFTRFNDALVLTARDQFSKDQRRHAVVILSDGIDSGRGTSTFETALRSLLERQVAVYVISNTEIERAHKQAELDNLLRGTESSVRFNEIRIDGLREGLRVLDLSERNLEQLTRATGGRLYKPQSFNDLNRVYTEIAEELRHQYALYFTPLNTVRDGRFRRVNVEVHGRPVQVTTRVGYFAPQS